MVRCEGLARGLNLYLGRTVATNRAMREIVAEKSPPLRAFFASFRYLFRSAEKYRYLDAASFVLLALALSNSHRKISRLKLQ